MNPRDEFILHNAKKGGKITYLTNESGHVIYVVKRVDARQLDVYTHLQALRCKNLPVIFDIISSDEQLEIHEEYIRGTNLFELQSECGTFSDSELIDIGADVCRALVELHSAEPPILHRDIKPQNIMRRDTGGYVLIDFDAARCYREDASSDTRCIATVGYAAPEQYGLAQTDVRSDLFSLGVTLYELKTGESYHVGGECGGTLKKIIKKCTAFDPKKRFSSAAQLLQRLEAMRPQNKPHIMKKRIVTAASILAGALVLFSAVYFAVLRPANQADEPAYVPVLAASPISADANTGANGSVECVCEPVDVEIVVPGGVTVPFYGSPVTLQLDSKIGFNKSICGAAEHDHDYSLKAYGIFDKSYGANAEITESGELTIYSQGLYWVDAILVHGDKPIKTVETCITATDTPEAEEECSCVISIGRNKSRMDLSGSDHLPTDGSPLYMQMYIETVIEDRLCTATHHKKLWAMQGYVEFAPEGAICGVTEDNQFYTDTPGLYSLRLPAWFDGNRIGFGGDLQVKADGE